VRRGRRLTLKNRPMIDRRPLIIAAVALLIAWGAVLVIMVDGAQALSLL